MESATSLSPGMANTGLKKIFHYSMVIYQFSFAKLMVSILGSEVIFVRVKERVLKGVILFSTLATLDPD